MAFLDDKTWLLNFVRNQFIVSDDTSMCENILTSEIGAEEPDGALKSFFGSAAYPVSRESGEPISSKSRSGAVSPDIVMNMDVRAAARRRSNTAVRLDKIRKERDEKSRIKISHWKSPKDVRNILAPMDKQVQDVGDFFAEVNITPREEKLQKRSALSTEVNQNESDEQKNLNPFVEFVKFAGIKQRPGVKTYKIFFHLLEQFTDSDRRKPMEICVHANARFLDVVGLVCWKYTDERHEPPLKRSVAYYSLFMAEDNGEIDRDMPQIDPTENVARFGQVNLAFVESDQPVSQAVVAPTVVKINLVEGSFSKIILNSTDVTLESILEKVLKKRKMNSVNRGLGYTLEKCHEPGVQLDLTQTLENAKTLEFWLIRLNSKNPAVSNIVQPGGSMLQH